MLFNELTFPFLVVTMLGYVAAAETNEIPICEPPAIRCSILKRSVCEWSDSGKPVWACRGFFETINNGPKSSQQKSANEVNDEEITYGTYEYQIPKSSKKIETQHDSESEDVQYGTYTYPIKSKNTKSSASTAESESEVKIGTYTLPHSSGKSSSELKVESGSEVRTGTLSLPVAGSRRVESARAGENSNDQVGTHNAGSEIEVGTLTLPVSYAKSNSLSKVESESEMQVGTYTVPLSKRISGKEVRAEPDSDIEMVKNTYQTPSIEKSSSSKVTSEDTVEMGTYTLSSKNSGGTEQSDSESSTQIGTYQLPSDSSGSRSVESESEVHLDTYTYPISSGKSSASSHADSEPINDKLGSYQAAFDRNTTAVGDDSESKLHAEVKANQANIKSSDSQVGAVSQENKIGTTSSMSSALSQTKTESQVGIHQTEVAEKSAVQSGSSESNVKQTSHDVSSGKSGSSVLNAGHESHLGLNSLVQSAQSDETRGDTLVESGSMANGAVQINQASSQGKQQSLTADGSFPSGFGTAGRQGLQTTGLEQTNFRYGQHIPGFPTAYYGQQYHTQMNGNAGAIHAAGSGSVYKNDGNVAQNRQPFGFPYYGYDGYQSLERSASSASSKPSATSGNGMYHWPSYWYPLANMGLGGNGANWLVGHNTPLINPSFNGVAPQNIVQSTNAGLYGSRSLNSVPHSTGTLSASPHHNPWSFISPFAQYFSNMALGKPTTDLSYCSFCKKLMGIFGGAAICDVLEPIILEFFNRVLDIFRTRLK